MWSEIKAALEGAGWLANGITFFLFLLPVAVFIFRKFRTRNRTPESALALASASQRKSSGSVVADIGEIAIVDDEPADFPIAELRASGYKVKSYKKVSLNDIPVLARYDLVFLDMHGVVKDDLQNGGLRLIGHLRTENPIQKICAVSSKTFDPTATEFFKRADDVQKKPISALKCQEVIEALLGEKFDSIRIATELDNELAACSGPERNGWLRDIAHAVGNVSAPVPALPKPLKENKVMAGLAEDLLKVLRHESS